MIGTLLQGFRRYLPQVSAAGICRRYLPQVPSAGTLRRYLAQVPSAGTFRRHPIGRWVGRCVFMRTLSIKSKCLANLGGSKFASLKILGVLFYALRRYLAQVPCAGTLRRYLPQVSAAGTCRRYLPQVPCAGICTTRSALALLKRDAQLLWKCRHDRGDLALSSLVLP